MSEGSMEDAVALYFNSEVAGWLTITGEFDKEGRINLYWQDARNVRSTGEKGHPLGHCESSDLLRLAKHFAPDKSPPPLPPSFSSVLLKETKE